MSKGRIRLEVEDVENNGDEVYNVVNQKGQTIGMIYRNSEMKGNPYSFWDLEGECWFMPDCLFEIARHLNILNDGLKAKISSKNEGGKQ